MISIRQLLAKHLSMCTMAQEICKQRGLEYSTISANTLKSFNIAAELRHKKASDICLSMICVKAARLEAQIELGKIPDDTFLDLINYIVYLKILLEEEKLG